MKAARAGIPSRAELETVSIPCPMRIPTTGSGSTLVPATGIMVRRRPPGVTPRVMTPRGFENVTGSAYDDRLTGDEGDPNVLKGGAGDDEITGAAGADTMEGGAGADELDGDDGNDDGRTMQRADGCK